MDKRVIGLWDNHKGKLEEFFRNHRMEEFNEYEKIVKLIIGNVLNAGDDGLGLSEEIRAIDDGDYQGTHLFLAHEETYQPGIDNYWVTHNSYGSCSGCDTLMAITGYDNENLPSAGQVKELMTLSLHIIQRFAPLSKLYQNG
jgi:hypothetical protein